jgi:esterase
MELAFERIADLRSERTIVFLHGMLGRGQNLRTIAKRFVEAQPGWAAWLVDLRRHGQSPKGTSAPSLRAAAQDVVDLAHTAGEPVSAIAGHSFGGKVALAAAQTGLIDSLQDVIVLDSVPGARAPVRAGDSPLAVMNALESLPWPLASKREFVDALVAKGQSRSVAQWLAGSVEREGDHVSFALDLNEIRGLVLEYYKHDLWPVVEHPPGNVRVHLVIGEHSDSYAAADRARATQVAAANERVTVDVLPAGHWVHVDDPDGVLRILLAALAPGESLRI